MRLLRLLSLFAIGAVPALLAGPCVTGTLSSYIALGSTGCSLGPFTDKDFAFTDISGIPITANDITVTPLFTSPSSGPALSDLNFTSPLFSVSGSNSLKISIAYFWDAADIRGLEEVMNDPVTAPGLASLSISACENANFVGLSCPTTLLGPLVLADNGSNPMPHGSFSFVPNTVSTLGMQDILELDGNGTGSASDLGGYHDIAQTPEPSALVLGLLPVVVGLGFPWLRRRHLHLRQGGF